MQQAAGQRWLLCYYFTVIWMSTYNHLLFSNMSFQTWRNGLCVRAAVTCLLMKHQLNYWRFELQCTLKGWFRQNMKVFHGNRFPSLKCLPLTQNCGGWESSTQCNKETYANIQNTSQISYPIILRTHTLQKKKMLQRKKTQAN